MTWFSGRGSGIVASISVVNRLCLRGVDYFYLVRFAIGCIIFVLRVVRVI